MLSFGSIVLFKAIVCVFVERICCYLLVIYWQDIVDVDWSVCGCMQECVWLYAGVWGFG